MSKASFVMLTLPLSGFEFWNYTFVRQDGVSDPVNIHLTFELDV